MANIISGNPAHPEGQEPEGEQATPSFPYKWATSFQTDGEHVQVPQTEKPADTTAPVTPMVHEPPVVGTTGPWTDGQKDEAQGKDVGDVSRVERTDGAAAPAVTARVDAVVAAPAKKPARKAPAAKKAAAKKPAKKAPAAKKAAVKKPAKKAPAAKKAAAKKPAKKKKA